jgi:hypothetical protein
MTIVKRNSIQATSFFDKIDPFFVKFVKFCLSDLDGVDFFLTGTSCNRLQLPHAADGEFSFFACVGFYRSLNVNVFSPVRDAQTTQIISCNDAIVFNWFLSPLEWKVNGQI